MRWSILDKLIRNGQLTVIAANGEQRQFGQGQPSVAVEFLDSRCFGDILRNPPTNFGKTYVEGRWRPAQGSDLYAVLRLLRLNFEQSQTRGNWSLLTQSVQAFLNSWNSVVASRRNVAHHYDQDETLFRACLDRDMHYSCAYFEDPATDLESAQHAKCEHIARKLRLQPGQRVLDIGCGWGSLALHLAEHHQVHVTGLTLSVEQLRVAKDRAFERGLTDMVDFQLQDYRLHNNSYDRVVSVGMFEHVGKAAYQKFFACVDQALGDEGIALIHTIANQRRAGLVNPWIRQNIFPGGHIPSAGQVIPAIEATGLVVADLECWRSHYALTLAEWHSRFNAQRSTFAEEYGESFCRLWEFYLLICQTAFEVGHLAVHHWQLVKGEPAQLPITRDYLYRS